MSKTMLAKTAELAWALLEANDIDPLPIFRKARADPKQMNDINARFTQATVSALWASTAAAINKPCFGIQAGQLWHPAYMHALGYAWLSSSSLRTALQRLVRFIHIVNQCAEIRLTESEDCLSIQWLTENDEIKPEWVSEARFSVLLAMCRANYGAGLEPVSVSFTHQQPDCAGQYFEYFRAPLHFSAAENLLTFALKDIDKQLSSSNHLMSQVHDQIMLKYLADLEDDNIIEHVKAAIIDQLPDGRVSDAKIAESLYMSNRTLQRRLQKANTSFKTILTEVRRGLAMKYIRDSRLTLTELSFQLGFSEMSSFSRAFKQWTGESPRGYRKTLM